MQITGVEGGGTVGGGKARGTQSRKQGTKRPLHTAVRDEGEGHTDGKGGLKGVKYNH